MLCALLCLCIASCGNGSSSTTGSVNNGGPNSSGGDNGGCTTGEQVINNISTEIFCGSAKAQATYQGRNFTWSQGSCFNEQGNVGVNIGHEVLDPTNSAAGNDLKKKYDYFGAVVQASADGTYQGDVAGYYQGQDITATGTVTLSKNLQAGSFTGKTILGGVDVTASWTCS